MTMTEAADVHPAKPEEASSIDGEESYDGTTDEEEEEEVPAAKAEEVDMDDDYALLAMAKQRMADQQAKQKELEQKEQERLAALESEEEDDDNDEGDGVTSDDNEDIVEGEKEKEAEQAIVANDDDDNLDDEEMGDESFTIEIEEEFGDEPHPNAPDPTPKSSASSPSKRPSSSGGGQRESFRRQMRDENAELWALLHQSKSRLEETKSLVAAVEERDKENVDTDDEDEDSEKPAATAEGEQQRSAGSVKKVDHESSSLQPIPDADEEQQDEKKDEETQKRNFQRENQELWELLHQSKRRLEEAAVQKVKQAEKAAEADSQAVSKRDLNPYKAIESLPDQEDDQDALTQKELLIAMAVAEEAARSGRDAFETPSRDVLRTTDIESFDFLKEKQQKPKPVPKTPIVTKTDQQTEENRFMALKNALSTRWNDFQERAKQIDDHNKANAPMALME